MNSKTGISLLNPKNDPTIGPVKKSKFQIHDSNSLLGIHLLDPKNDPKHNPQMISFFEREIRQRRHVPSQEQLKSKIELCNVFKRHCVMIYTADQCIFIKFQFREIKFQLFGEKWYMCVIYTGVSHLNLMYENRRSIFTRYHDNLLKDHELLNYFKLNQL